MNYLIAIFIFILVTWLLVKRSSLAFATTFLILLFPLVIIFTLGGYIYAICFSFVIYFYISLNDYKKPTANNYKKILTAIPFICLMYYITRDTKGFMIKTNYFDIGDVKYAVLLSAATIFISTIGAIIILRRTKGETGD